MFSVSLIDFFISGVPTLSASFARAYEILTDKDSIVYKQGDNKDLSNKLNYIYNNQNILKELRLNSFARRDMYSVETFDKYLNNTIQSNFEVK